MATLKAMQAFIYDLDAKCQADSACEARLRNVLQIFPMAEVTPA